MRGAHHGRCRYGLVVVGLLMAPGACGPATNFGGAATGPPTHLSESDTRAGPKSADRKAASLNQRARRLHRSALLLDGHNDIPMAMAEHGFDLGGDGGPGAPRPTHTDLARLAAGGVGGLFFAIFVPGKPLSPPSPDRGVPPGRGRAGTAAAGRAAPGRALAGTPPDGGSPPVAGRGAPSRRASTGAFARACAIIDVLLAQIRRYAARLELATTAADVVRIRRQGKVAALMGLEGGHLIENDLEKLRHLHRLGARYLTLTHSHTIEWADSSGDEDDPTIPHHGGLTSFGREVIRELNRLGMMVDLSHVTEATLRDAVQVSRAPVIASHSSARALADHPRNLTDEGLKAIAGTGGVVLVNFFTGFIDPRQAALVSQVPARRRALERQHPSQPDVVTQQIRAWWAAQGVPRPALGLLVDHIDHIVRVAGIDHVGLGSDFDGVPHDMVPTGLDDVAHFPNLTKELLRRGYADEAVRKILGGNLLRVMGEVERVAARIAASSASPPQP